MDEAIAAEDLAIQYADVTRGHRSGHFAGNDVYRQTREQCIAMLFDAVASHHRVSIEDVHGAVGDRRAGVDLIVLASFAMLYTFVCGAIARWIFRAIPVEDVWVRALTTTIGAGVVAAAGLVSFGLYAGLIEIIRIGNTHMSYRVGRNPWASHQIELLAGGVVLFALVAGYYHLSLDPIVRIRTVTVRIRIFLGRDVRID